MHRYGVAGPVLSLLDWFGKYGCLAGIRPPCVCPDANISYMFMLQGQTCAQNDQELGNSYSGISKAPKLSEEAVFLQ